MDIRYKFKELRDLVSWDSAVSFVQTNLGLLPASIIDNIQALIEVYYLHRKTIDYRASLDPDAGIAYTIRAFAIEQITTILEDAQC